MIHASAYIHPNALVEKDVTIGPGTNIWAFCHVLSGAVIGSDCNICDHTFIEGNVRVGNRVTIKSGVYLWDGIVVEDNVFIGPCAAFTNDKVPRSKQYPEQYPDLILGHGSSIGANATVLPGITIGKMAMIGAGSVVTHDIPDYALVYGNPAKHKGWVCQCGNKVVFPESDIGICDCGKKYKKNADIVVEIE